MGASCDSCSARSLQEREERANSREQFSPVSVRRAQEAFKGGDDAVIDAVYASRQFEGLDGKLAEVRVSNSSLHSSSRAIPVETQCAAHASVAAVVPAEIQHHVRRNDDPKSDAACLAVVDQTTGSCDASAQRIPNRGPVGIKLQSAKMKCGWIVMYLWFCFFFFPMMHDVAHELGHASFYLGACNANTTSISLGEASNCSLQEDEPIAWCVRPGWFYMSLYRSSRTMTYLPDDLPDSCSAQVKNMIGGISGMVGCWLMMVILVSGAWKFMFTSVSIRKSFLVGATWLFVPLRWLRQEIEQQPLRFSFWPAVALGFGATACQIDMLNDIAYAFFPSRIIIWFFMDNGDGTKLWRTSGFSQEDIINISYGVWAALLVCYIMEFALLFRYVCSVRALLRTEDTAGSPVDPKWLSSSTYAASQP